MTHAERFERQMAELRRELEMLKKKKQLDRREHRLAWRRAYYARQQGKLSTAGEK